MIEDSSICRFVAGFVFGGALVTSVCAITSSRQDLMNFLAVILSLFMFGLAFWLNGEDGEANVTVEELEATK